MPKPYTPNDKLSQKAAAEGYRARSVYKLQELDEKYSLLSPAFSVLDLGASPGSWLQYASKKIGPKGRAIGLDLNEIEPIDKNVKTYVQDITDIDAVDRILDKEGISEVDLVLSDLAPSTSGIKDVDQWKSIELSQAVSKIALRVLRPKGFCVIKVLRGGDFDKFITDLKKEWKDVKIVQVKASRDRSREIYLILSK